MKYLVLVSHGDFAEGLKTSLSMFASDKIDQVIALGLKNGQSADDFAETFKQAISVLNPEDTLVLLADIIGGSPLTSALNVLSDLSRLEGTRVIGGMNLPMALTAAITKDVLEGDAFVSGVIQESVSGIQEFNVVNETNEDDI
ncbi:hypothetical protein HMPREF9943_01644 [Eggerthia catenaformis OT 569 = DSM 20559]|uniref:PTS EIIA type-4 domain-containing protein n=1 Tax=Eggerthia catenaformis OT 569 = DSM 20559 TaxID=999415 RepID=M2Q1T1_9FIRM|nr:hypothetical protein [Eggerthia catenaformis]EMD16241.1 hypothetical protein HMPREF9943_01644 [Eggerthia catenaformis OT 569 = DSM 20559]OUC50917.1 PTS fructose transporter subunit IIA [Eggerthia catenaformis]